MDVNGGASTASCLFHSFSTQPSGTAANERADCAPAQEQAGRVGAAAALGAWHRGGVHTTWEELQGKVPWGRDPHCRLLYNSSPSNWQPEPCSCLGWRFRSTQALQAGGGSSRAPCTALTVPARQGDTHRNGSLPVTETTVGTPLWFCSLHLHVPGKGAHLSPQHRGESEPAPYLPEAWGTPLPTQYHLSTSSVSCEW